MSSQKTLGNTTSGQSKKFIDKARDLGCDEDESALDEKLKRIVPKPKQKEKTPAK